MFNKFRNDPNYLTKYHLTVAGLLFCVNALLFYFNPPLAETLLWYAPIILLMTSTELKVTIPTLCYAFGVAIFKFDFSAWNLLAILPAFLITFPLTTGIHSPSHGAMRPKWLNRPIGELTGLFHLTGFPDWTVIHVFHHQNSDHPELDPHAPLDKGYFKFAFGMRAQAAACFVRHYFKYFGQNELSMKRLQLFSRASRLNMLMKVSFWFLVFGPKYFTFFYVPAILIKMFHYAWFNWATHRPDDQGRYVIKNLDTNLLYRWINLTAAGVYYHGNHHNNPGRHNPTHAKSPSSNADAA